MPNFVSKYIQLNQLKLHYLDSEPHDSRGSTAPSEKHALGNQKTIIFLHGFPQYSGVWRNQMQYFSDNYRVIAPDLPGYHLSDKPKDSDFYRVENLISVIAEFITEVSDTPVYLVAHDWGGAIAWPLTAFKSELVDKLIILNAAHPSTFTREILQNSQQQSKSEYIADLISPEGVELVSQNDFQYLRELILADNAQLPMSDKEWQEHVATWLQPGAIESMLKYYRNMPLNQKDMNSKKIPNIRIEKPTLVLWGIDDSAFCPEILDGLEQYVLQLKIIKFESATHWLHHEIPQQINAEIEKFIT